MFVILTQMVLGGLSVYTLSGIRAFVSGESLWSKGQQQAIYFLDRYFDTAETRFLDAFDRNIAVPLAYRRGRQEIFKVPPDPRAAGAAFVAAGTAPEDIPSVLWIFRNFRGFPYLEDALTRWEEADKYVLELASLGRSMRDREKVARPGDLRARLGTINAEITPRAIAFSNVLDDGARVVERLLLLANAVLALILAALTIWRVGRVLGQRRRFEDALEWQASHDDLTGVVNRRAFEANLLTALGAARGRSGCALMFIDLDQFKIINDTCGHAAGDAMLKRVGQALGRRIGQNDLLARLGGDEFGILLRDIAPARAFAVAEAVREAVASIDFSVDGRGFKVTASIGLVHDSAGANSPAVMMSKADIACLLAKEKGRNRIHTHREEDEELRDRISEMSWVQRIRQALDEDRFCLYAQEIVALTDAGAGLHLEVLIRMHDEAGHLVPPSSFLPAAERFGLMKQVDRWVVHRAFRTLAERRTIEHAEPIGCCGINLSGATVGDEAFLDYLKDAFARYRVAPDQICFEITETTAIVNLDAARSFIQDLRGIGCTFALDDFGSGMSSFNYLKELPVDFIKIDGAFVRNMLTERADRAMVEMINHVGHVMGKAIVAEFVESEEIADVLRDIGIDYAQGYGIAPPKPFTAQFEGVGTALRYPNSVERRLSA